MRGSFWRDCAPLINPSRTYCSYRLSGPPENNLTLKSRRIHRAKKLSTSFAMKKKGSQALYPPVKDKTSTHDYSVDARRVIASVAKELRADGSTWEQVFTFLSKAAPGVSGETVRKWVGALNSGKDPFKDEKNAGRPEILLDEHVRIVVGFIISECDRGEIVKLEDAHRFLLDKLKVDVVDETLRLRLPPMGVRIKLARFKLKGKKPLSVMVAEYKEFVHIVRQFHAQGFLLVSLDFTYTSHRTAAPTTLAPLGKPVKSISKISRNTNTIVTGLVSDGRQLDSHTYTLSSEFRTDRTSTARRDELTKRLSSVLAEHKVADDRICYDGALKGERGTFRGEYSEMVTDYLDHVLEPLAGEKILFLSDNGNAFKEDDVSVIEKKGQGKHLFYPACVHQYLSPNDNNLHGVAKARWRSKITDFSDDVRATVALMAELDAVPAAMIKGWFERNFFLAGGIVRDEDIIELISGKKSKWTRIHEDCLARYQDYAGIEEEVSPEDRRLSSGLDGQKWA